MSRRVSLLMASTLVLMGVGVDRCTASLSSATPARGESVVLLHGLMTGTWHMTRIERALARGGYNVVNWGYDSRHGTIEEHADALAAVVRELPPDRAVHFVGFSLGSLIARYYLSHHVNAPTGRFVMIGPPNHGSELADALYPQAWFRALAGSDATGQLRTGDPEFFAALGVPRARTGVIAGGRGDDTGFRDELPGDDDGRVSVSSARLDGASDFIVLPHRHVMLLVADDTLHQVLTFLHTGRFDHGTAFAPADHSPIEEATP